MEDWRRNWWRIDEKELLKKRRKWIGEGKTKMNWWRKDKELGRLSKGRRMIELQSSRKNNENYFQWCDYSLPRPEGSNITNRLIYIERNVGMVWKKWKMSVESHRRTECTRPAKRSTWELILPDGFHLRSRAEMRVTAEFSWFYWLKKPCLGQR